MISAGDRVVVALSGGSDSVGLLHLLLNLREFDLKIIAAHYNHKLRGSESERDAIFVEQLSRDLGVEFEYGEVEQDHYRSVKSGFSPEETARELRYRFLNHVLEKCKAQKIATAHTMNDQAETVIMRIIRGSGVRGLSGIPPVNGRIVRPLIQMQKQEIKDYLRLNQINWTEDFSNNSTRFQRNKIRLELFPILKEINPNIDQVLLRSSEIFRIESEFIDSCIDEVYRSVITEQPFGYIGRSIEYLSQNKAVRLGILRKTIELLKGKFKNVSAVHIFTVDEMIGSDIPSGEIVLPDGIRFNKGYGIFCMSNNPGLGESYSYKINGQGFYSFENGLEIRVDVTSDGSEWGDESVGFFSVSKVKFPLTVGSYKAGDRFKPLGMKGSKKIKNVFIDKKIPKFMRKSIPVFQTVDGVIWVGGVRSDDRFKVEKGESEFLRIKIKKPELSFLEKIRTSESHIS